MMSLSTPHGWYGRMATQVQFPDAHGVVLIVGENGQGKSRMLHSIELAIQSEAQDVGSRSSVKSDKLLPGPSGGHMLEVGGQIVTVPGDMSIANIISCLPFYAKLRSIYATVYEMASSDREGIKALAEWEAQESQVKALASKARSLGAIKRDLAKTGLPAPADLAAAEQAAKAELKIAQARLPEHPLNGEFLDCLCQRRSPIFGHIYALNPAHGMAREGTDGTYPLSGVEGIDAALLFREVLIEYMKKEGSTGPYPVVLPDRGWSPTSLLSVVQGVHGAFGDILGPVFFAYPNPQDLETLRSARELGAYVCDVFGDPLDLST